MRTEITFIQRSHRYRVSISSGSEGEYTEIETMWQCWVWQQRHRERERQREWERERERAQEGDVEWDWGAGGDSSSIYLSINPTEDNINVSSWQVFCSSRDPLRVFCALISTRIITRNFSRIHPATRSFPKNKKKEKKKNSHPWSVSVKSPCCGKCEPECTLSNRRIARGK